MLKTFGLTADELLTCGCHVHVSVEDDEEGVAVLDRIRIWLPVLTALSLEFGMETEIDESVDVRAGDEIDRAAVTAVAAARSAARHELLTTESHAAVSAVTARDLDFCFVNKHRKAGPGGRGARVKIRNQELEIRRDFGSEA